LSGSNQNGAIEDFLSDNYPDAGSTFPLTKEKFVQALSESYGMDGISPDSQWIDLNLPAKSYKDLNDLVANLISHLPPIRWDKNQQTDLLWKYPSQRLALGQQLYVGQDQEAVLVAIDGKKACDSFKNGTYVFSKENCQIAIANSRQIAPELQEKIGFGPLDGFPVFLRPSMEIEIEISSIGQTKALRRITARGVARVRISNSKSFLETAGSKGDFKTDSVIASMKKYCDEIVQKEMSNHDFEELKGNNALLEKVVVSCLQDLGLQAVRVSFSWIGEMGPGMFSSGAMPPMMMDPQKIAQMRQMAEAMRNAQIANMRAPQTQRGFSEQASKPPATICPSCNAPNPLDGKFCNNCGKPLPAVKRVCPKCGEQVDSGIKFCGNCGTKLN
jgi:hypothetical protein